MKSQLMLAALAATFCAPVVAGDLELLSVEEIVQITGMEKKEVQLMLGAHSNNHLYLTSFDRVTRNWKRALNENDLILTRTRTDDGRLIVQVFRAEDDAS